MADTEDSPAGPWLQGNFLEILRYIQQGRGDYRVDPKGFYTCPYTGLIHTACRPLGQKNG